VGALLIERTADYRPRSFSERYFALHIPDDHAVERGSRQMDECREDDTGFVGRGTDISFGAF
jgi:hypothetical protein